MDNITTPVVTAFDRNVAIDSFIFGVDLFSVADPDPGHFVSLFEVQDFGVDGGFFALNDLTLEPGVFHQISPAEIANLQYFGDDEESFETFGVRVTDSAGNVSGTDFGIVSTVLADTFNAPTVTAFTSLVGVNSSIPALSMFAVFDPDEDFFVAQYEFIDFGEGGGSFFLNGTTLEAGVFHVVTPDQIANLEYRGDDEVSQELFGVRVTDSGGNLSNESVATVATLFADFFTSPTVTALPTAAPLNSSIDLLDMIRVEDPDFGASVATYQIRDNGVGGGSFVLNGQELAPNVFHDVADFQLGGLSYETSSVESRETFTVRVIDGSDNISNTSTSIVTSGNSASVVTAVDGRVLPLEIVSLADFISVSDIDGDTAQTIGILDRNNSFNSGNFEVRNESLPQAQFAFFEFNELDDILYRGGSAPGSEEISVLIFDGSSFSEEVSFTLTTSAPPVITSNNEVVLENQPRLVSDLITFSDVDGDTAVAYNIIDRRINEDGGFFVLDGVRQESGQFFNVTAEEFERLIYVGASNGPQSENLAFHVFDSGGQWSELIDITIATETLPTVEVENFAIRRDQFVNIATGGISNATGAQAEGTPFLDFFDRDGDEIEQLLFLDRQANLNGGHFLLNGVRLPSASFFSVTPDELVNLEYRGGTFGPQTENLSVIAFSNSGQASEQVGFQIVTLQNEFRPEVEFFSAGGRLGTSIQLSTLINFTDQDGDAPVSFSFFDTGDSATSGFFTDNGVVLNPREFQTFQFSQIDDIQYNFGSVGGSEVVRLVVNDGRSSSELVSATLTSIDTPEFEVTDNSISLDTIERIDVSTLIAQTDSGPAFTQYEIFDENAATISGRFELDGVDLQQGVLHTLTAAEFANLQFVGAEADFGRQLDPILIRASNGVTGFTEWERININSDPVGGGSLTSGAFWNPDADGITRITYTFIDGADPLPSYYDCGADEPPVQCEEPTPLSPLQREATRNALETVTRFANIEFEEVAPIADASDATIIFGLADLDSISALGVAFQPDEGGIDPADGQGALAGDVFLNVMDFGTGSTDVGVGSLFGQTLLHEIGHALGLDHAFAFSGNPSGNVTTILPNASDFRYNTVLSTNANEGSVFNPFPNENPEDAGTFQIYDVVELQRIYGANVDFNTGDNQYGNFFSGSDPHFVDNDTAHQTTLYDAGGLDTFNYTNHVADETIDLRQGAWSTINGVEISVLIAYGTVIENARGGSGNDTIQGNEVRNLLIGNDGNDVLRGGGGNDVLRGLAGDDTFIWDLGDGRDAIQEQGGGGVDVLEIQDPSGALDALEDDLTFRRLGDNLRIDLTFEQQAGQGSVTIQNFADPDSQVEILRLTDSQGNQIGGDIDLVGIFDQATNVGTRFEVTALENVFDTYSAFAASPV